MRSKVVKLLMAGGILIAVSILLLLSIRVWDAQRGPPLALWHTHVPNDLKAADLGKIEWEGYVKAEQALFDEVRAKVTQKLEPEDRTAANRYFDGSPIYPGQLRDTTGIARTSSSRRERRSARSCCCTG